MNFQLKYIFDTTSVYYKKKLWKLSLAFAPPLQIATSPKYTTFTALSIPPNVVHSPDSKCNTHSRVLATAVYSIARVSRLYTHLYGSRIVSSDWWLVAIKELDSSRDLLNRSVIYIKASAGVIIIQRRSRVSNSPREAPLWPVPWGWTALNRGFSFAATVFLGIVLYIYPSVARELGLGFCNVMSYLRGLRWWYCGSRWMRNFYRNAIGEIWSCKFLVSE